MGRAIWRVTEKPKIAIFGPGPGPVQPHGEAGLDGSGVLSCLGSNPGGTTQIFLARPQLKNMLDPARYEEVKIVQFGSISEGMAARHSLVVAQQLGGLWRYISGCEGFGAVPGQVGALG